MKTISNYVHPESLSGVVHAGMFLVTTLDLSPHGNSILGAPCIFWKRVSEWEKSWNTTVAFLCGQPSLWKRWCHVPHMWAHLLSEVALFSFSCLNFTPSMQASCIYCILYSMPFFPVFDVSSWQCYSSTSGKEREGGFSWITEQVWIKCSASHH